MMTKWRQGLAIALVGLVAGLGACGDPEADDTNQSVNASDNQNGEENQNGENQEEESFGCEDDIDPWELPIPDEFEAMNFNAEYELRMTDFRFESASPGSALNAILGPNIEDQDQNYPVVVLLEFSEIDVEAGTFQVRGGAGLKSGNEGDYMWDDSLTEPEFAEGEFHESGAMVATLPLLNFVATMETETELLKTVIPIRNLELSAQMEVASNGSEPLISDARLRGVVVGEEADEVDVALPGGSKLLLTQVLKENEKNFDKSCDGTVDSWLMTAGFDAAETTIVD